MTYPDGYKRYRIVEEHPDGTDIVLTLEDFDELSEAEHRLSQLCDGDNVYLVDAEDFAGDV